MAFDDVQPLGEIAVQLVASVLLQLRVELPPPAIELGEAVRVTVGAGVKVPVKVVWSI